MRMADPANTKLGRMLLGEITPVVMVLRTPLVEESCRKNGLSLIEMLTPYSNFNNIDGRVCKAYRTMSGATDVVFEFSDWFRFLVSSAGEDS